MPKPFELRKALKTSSESGAALLPFDLENYLNEELLELQPLAVLLDVVPAGGLTHNFTVRTSHPQGWFEGETTPANAKNSTYKRNFTQMKIQRIWGSVPGFQQAMSEPFIDALEAELRGSLEGMSNVLEYGCMWGAANDLGFTGDEYQYSGLFAHLAANAEGNIIDGGGAKISLELLDETVATVSRFRGVQADPKFWNMGLRMKQVIDGLQTKISIPLTNSVLEDGKITMRNYADIPINETAYTVPEAVSSSPADLAGVGAAGGVLAEADYLYRIASVTVMGEQVAAAAVTGSVESGEGTVNLSWSADANAKLYYIFRKPSTSGTYQLIDIIPALAYDAEGTVNGFVETYVDAGAKTPRNIKPLEIGEQNIFLINRHQDRGVQFLGKVDDMGSQMDNIFSYVELARVKDTYDYMLKGYLGFRAKYPNTAGAILRNVKLKA